MNTAQRFQAALAFEPVDRLPVIEWAPWWDQTLARWRVEGLPEQLTRVPEIAAWLGLDPIERIRISGCGPTCPSRRSPGGPRLECPTEAAYEQIRPHLYPQPAYDPVQLQRIAQLRRSGQVITWLAIDGFFWFQRLLLGIEEHLLAFYDQPQLIQRINRDHADFVCRAVAEVIRVCPVDCLSFAEDLSYNLGPMLSRECFATFVQPYYQPVLELLAGRPTRVLIDSDGLIDGVAPWFENAGVHGTLPVERQSGSDIVKLAAAHPRFVFVGGIDKRLISRGEDALQGEFARLQPALARGGFIPSADHQTPPDASLQDYRRYVAMLQELAHCHGCAPVAAK